MTMKNLYVPFEIPNLEIVQQQLLKCIPESYLTSEPKAFTCDIDVLKENCPELIDWLVSNSKVEILHYRFYITPPKARLLAHIDGGGTVPTVPFRLNIPVQNTKGTRLTFYNTSEDNKQFSIPDGYLTSLHPIDYKKLEPIESLELLTPHFVNTSVLHGVRNPLSTYRIIFAVTWQLDHDKWRDVEEVFNV